MSRQHDSGSAAAAQQHRHAVSAISGFDLDDPYFRLAKSGLLAQLARQPSVCEPVPSRARQGWTKQREQLFPRRSPVEATATQGCASSAEDSGPSNRKTLLRDTNGDGVPEYQGVFLDYLNSPFGVALIGNDLYR
ncbi:hypothetical protein EN816_06230 [Mesorhizobium sp. M8A.F.Ca.ET.173.01.1.1]|nr:hypothetical protein EN816_06230 [Mesorhizobium sp. M8A.F.Ca.ET.173.01.1.1]